MLAEGALIDLADGGPVRREIARRHEFAGDAHRFRTIVEDAEDDGHAGLVGNPKKPIFQRPTAPRV
ncbi:hypothetical protein, partial [Thermaurantiacus sp.]